MGRTVGHSFHIDNEGFVGNYLKKKVSDPDFSVQKISGGNIYGWFAAELPGIFPDEEPWWVLLCIAKNNFLKEESQLLPNHHIVHSLCYAIPELESQLLPNGSIWDGVGNSWVELESQLLPNRHIMKVAIDMLAELESQLLPNWLALPIWYPESVFPEVEPLVPAEWDALVSCNGMDHNSSLQLDTNF